MPHKILIVDDDKEFNTLLTDVFQQADYVVETCESVDLADERLKKAAFDLVVTDYRMPGRSGMELVDSVLELAPGVPIIMVSGYLENSVIRTLISRGVGGIFMKPLNIFSLLKKATDLIEKAQQKQSGEGTEGLPGGNFGADLPFDFQSFPAKDERCREFAHKLYEKRNFSKNLLLIGNPGIDLKALCNDLVNFSEQKDVAIFLAPERLTREALFDDLEAAIEEGAEQITFVFSETASLNSEQCALIYQLARQKGPFAALSLPKRFIFFLHRDLNHYYDAGLIDEEFYIFLGSAEMTVPELTEMPEDIPLLADAILEAAAPGKRFDPAARAALARYEWPGHVAELRKAVETAAHWSNGNVVKSDDMRAILEKSQDGGAGESGSALASHLRLRKEEYLEAMQKLSPFIEPGHEGAPGSS